MNAGVALGVVPLGPVESYVVASGVGARSGEFDDAIGQVGRLLVAVALARVLLGAIRVPGVPGW